MITITYNQLGENVDTEHVGLVSRLEGLTGPRELYGLDQPINILDIIDHVSLDDGLICFEYLSNSFSTKVSIAINCLKAHTLPWSKVFPGDTRMLDLINSIDLYYQSKDIVPVPKTDYCGDAIPGFYGVIPINQITDSLASIVASVNAQNTVGVVYWHYFYALKTSPWTQEEIDAANAPALVSGEYEYMTTGGLNVTDPTILTATNLHSYTPQQIDEALLRDPDFYLKDSYLWDSQIDPGYAYPCLVRRRILMGIDDQNDLINYFTLAVQDIANILQIVIDMVLYDAGDLTPIIIGIRKYMWEYETGRRLEMASLLARMNDIKRGFLCGPTGDPISATYEQQLIDAGLNARAGFMRNSVIINSYDTNMDGILSDAERTALENGARALMVATRAALGTQIYNQLYAEMVALPTLSSGQSLVDVLTPYLL
jgi:uncharacterized protein YbcI